MWIARLDLAVYAHAMSVPLFSTQPEGVESMFSVVLLVTN